MSYNILTIEREFGTGGYSVATQLSDDLGIPFYDHSTLRLLLKKPELLQSDKLHNFTRRPNSLLYSLATYISSESGFLFEVDDDMARQEFGLIRRITEKGPCIILGRCSNYILRNRPDVYSIFIKGDIETKKIRLRDLVGDLGDDNLEKALIRTDQARKNYYEHHTSRKWGDPESFNQVFDRREMSIDDIVTSVKKKMVVQTRNYFRQRNMYR